MVGLSVEQGFASKMINNINAYAKTVFAEAQRNIPKSELYQAEGTQTHLLIFT